MPKSWLCFIALILPLAFRVLMLDTDFVNGLWYRQDFAAYNMLNALRAQPLFLEFIGGWPLPVFVVTVCCYWIMDEDSDSIPGQLLLLPIVYLPFTIIGDWLVSRQFHAADLYVHPLVLLPVGYAYVLTWALFIRILDKLRLVM